jgi:septation ring formation regulator EzrA
MPDIEIIEETLEQKIERLERALDFSNQKLRYFEMNGIAKLYYSLNRKANEMAELLNKHTLSNLTLDDPKDKTFERLKIIWNDSSSLTEAIKSLEQTAGITGDESKDMQPRFRITPESIADNMGNIAGSQKK